MLVLCRHVREGDALHAAELADALAHVDAAAVYTSPLARARATAVPVAARHGLTPVEVEELREIDFGDVDGLGFGEYPPELRRGLLEAPARVRFPGGETYAELRSRVVAALEALSARHDGTVIAVSHAGSVRAALAAWLLMDDTALFRLDQRYGAINVVELIAGTPLVRLVNAERLR